MWRSLLLGSPLLGLVLFFFLSFEPALICYIALVLLAYLLYYTLTERVNTSKL